MRARRDAGVAVQSCLGSLRPCPVNWQKRPGISIIGLIYRFNAESMPDRAQDPGPGRLSLLAQFYVDVVQYLMLAWGCGGGSAT